MVRHPRWEPYARIGPVRFCAGGAFDSASEACRQRQPPPFHYKEIISLVQRDARGVSQTPGLSGSAVVLLDQGAPVLHSHERVPFFAGSMISSPAAAAAALRASRTRRKDVEFDAHAMLPVQFYFLVRRSSSPRKGVSFRRCGQQSRHDRDERHGDAEKIDRGGKEHEHDCIHAIGPVVAARSRQ